MTSSSGLVDAIKSIDRENDAPVTLWLSLIGNDVCKSDTNYTPVDEFYSDAVATLTRLDQMLPKGSVVVSLALFNGEILYDTTHAQTHPLGTTYAAVYDWMICLQVTPCYGWLNSNADIRRQTSAHANKLNEQYVKIQAQSKTLFKNIDYLYFAAPYDEIFGGYVKSGFKGIDLIERVDGFHPSQAGNAAFAVSFWKWLAESHPEAIGQVNPHNAEIDALFFANK
jgi:acyloxyacyl hydrolase